MEPYYTDDWSESLNSPGYEGAMMGKIIAGDRNVYQLIYARHEERVKELALCCSNPRN